MNNTLVLPKFAISSASVQSAFQFYGLMNRIQEEKAIASVNTLVMFDFPILLSTSMVRFTSLQPVTAMVKNCGKLTRPRVFQRH